MKRKAKKAAPKKRREVATYWLMRSSDGHEWETASTYKRRELRMFNAKPVKRLGTRTVL